MSVGSQITIYALAAGACGLATWILLRVVIPIMRARTLVHPNARSSHVQPTPQGAGLVIVPVVLVACGILAAALPSSTNFALLAATALGMMVLGLWDDVAGLPVVPRLAGQFLAVALLIALMPGGLRFCTDVPIYIERAILILALAWFVNLTNFMDGIDLMSVCESVSICAGLMALALLGSASTSSGWIAAALAGAMFGFAVWNWPPARIFLGDTGSLPIGLILGYLLIHTAMVGSLAAALILPAYYLADATLTLVMRMMRGEPFWQAHRDHFYQQAVRAGMSHRAVVARILALNIALVILALIAARGTASVALASSAVAAVLVGFTLWSLQAAGAKNAT